MAQKKKIVDFYKNWKDFHASDSVGVYCNYEIEKALKNGGIFFFFRSFDYGCYRPEEILFINEVLHYNFKWSSCKRGRYGDNDFCSVVYLAEAEVTKLIDSLSNEKVILFNHRGNYWVNPELVEKCLGSYWDYQFGNSMINKEFTSDFQWILDEEEPRNNPGHKPRDLFW